MGDSMRAPWLDIDYADTHYFVLLANDHVPPLLEHFIAATCVVLDDRAPDVCQGRRLLVLTRKPAQRAPQCTGRSCIPLPPGTTVWDNGLWRHRYYVIDASGDTTTRAAYVRHAIPVQRGETPVYGAGLLVAGAASRQLDENGRFVYIVKDTYRM